MKEKDALIDRLFFNSVHEPPKVVLCSSKPSKVQENPYDARSPQEVLDAYGLYRDPSYYEQNPDKVYCDFSNIPDFETLMNEKISIERKFRNLPLDVRASFNHDVSEFVQYVNSSSFDVERLLDEPSKKAYQSYKAELKAKEDFKKYQNSDEYKKLQQEASLRIQFENEQFEKWKSSQSIT